jgi:ABC-type multidrug transport system fused ATPase/permease subunit
MKRASAYRVYRIFGRHLKTYWKWFLLAYCALFASVAMTLLRPWPLKLILDHVLLDKQLPPLLARLAALIGRDKLDLLALLSAGIVAIIFLEGLFSFARKYYMSGAGEKMINDIRQEAFGHLQTLGHGRGSSGDLIVRLTSDIHSLKLLLTRYLQTLVDFLFTFVGISVTMFLLDWRLTLLALVVTPPLYAVSLYSSGRIEELVRQKRARESEVASLLQETVTSQEIVQAFAREEEEKERFAEEADESLKASMGSIRLSKGFEKAVRLIMAVGTALVVYYGARRVLAGEVTPGDLIVFTAYLRDLYRPVGGFSELILDFAGALVSGERIAEILEAKVEVTEAPDAVEAPPFRGEVAFEGVTFGYAPGSPVLQDLSFAVRPGQRVALIGSSGTGKTTIVNLLLRFYDPWEGRIRIDGEDIRRYKIKSLREQISVVLQETLLFRRTVRENIAYGKPDASLAEITAAAKAAQADGFITKMPRGYETFLEERGGNLSGGQRQRIALARAILKDTPIFILDEPVTGLDAETEARLNRTLDRLMRGKTSFIVAHRFSTVMSADLILLIEEGRVVEKGTHAELLTKNGHYRRLHDLQRFGPAGGTE